MRKDISNRLAERRAEILLSPEQEKTQRKPWTAQRLTHTARLAAEQEKIQRRAERQQARTVRLAAEQAAKQHKIDRPRAAAFEYWYYAPDVTQQSIATKHGISRSTLRRTLRITDCNFLRRTKYQAIVLAYFGSSSSTMDMVGKRYGLTKQRIEQITKESGLDLALLRQASALSQSPKSEDVSPATVDVDSKRTPEYQVFRNMIQRCTNPKHPQYPTYGGRGVRLCDTWNPKVVGSKAAWNTFCLEMGPRPAGQNGKRALYSINRIDNVPLYSKATCEWTTQKEQCAEGQRRKVGIRKPPQSIYVAIKVKSHQRSKRENHVR